MKKKQVTKNSLGTGL